MLTRCNSEATLQTTQSIQSDQGFATIRVHGSVSVDGLKTAFETLFHTPAWKPGYHLMIVYEADALLGNLTLSDLEAIHAYTIARAQGAKLDKPMKSALIYSRLEHQSMLELHRLAKRYNGVIEECVFDTEAEARAWLAGQRAGDD